MKAGRPRSLVLYGKSLVGKTTWARSLGPHVYFLGAISGSIAIRDMPNAEYAVFDDMRGGISFFHSWKEWLGGQKVVTVKKMYRDPVQIKWGRPTIYCCNADPREEMKCRDDIEWLEANCTFVYVEHSLISHANTG